MNKDLLMSAYKKEIFNILELISDQETVKIIEVAQVLANHIKNNKVIHIWGPGGHSNLAAMEIFFRAGGLMHVNAILNTETMLNYGALKSMQVERLPGYGEIVIEDNDIGKGDLLIIVNAYGINSATIDAALTANKKGAITVGISSHRHANNTPENHVARHPSKKNLHEIVDYSIDSKLEVGDACISIEDFDQKVGALSTFVNAYILNSLVIETIDLLVKDGIHPPVWMSGNAEGGDAWNNQFINDFRNRIRML